MPICVGVGDLFTRLFMPVARRCFGGGGRLLQVGVLDIDGEFDPGSGRTLAACLTHASRTVKPFGVDQWRTGE